MKMRGHCKNPWINKRSLCTILAVAIFNQQFKNKYWAIWVKIEGNTKKLNTKKSKNLRNSESKSNIFVNEEWRKLGGKRKTGASPTYKYWYGLLPSTVLGKI